MGLPHYTHFRFRIFNIPPPIDFTKQGGAFSGARGSRFTAADKKGRNVPRGTYTHSINKPESICFIYRPSIGKIYQYLYIDRESKQPPFYVIHASLLTVKVSRFTAHGPGAFQKCFATRCMYEIGLLPRPARRGGRGGGSVFAGRAAGLESASGYLLFPVMLFTGISDPLHINDLR